MRVALIAEDKLTLAVLQKCISELLPEFKIIRSEVKNGRGNVQREINAYNNLAKTIPVVAVVDLDSDPCPSHLIDSWVPNKAPNLILRIAIREIESWVLADRKQLAKFINTNSDNIPRDTDNLEDPKHFLLELARQYADTDLKNDLIPRNYGQYPRIGPAYNFQMCQFVAKKWRPRVASKRSASLAKAVLALERLTAP